MDPLRSAVQLVTHNIPAPIQNLGVSLIGGTCYQAIVLDVDLRNTACLKYAISKGLGVAIIAASSIVKVPQIVKLVNSRSAAGVSFLSYLLETSAYLITLAYNVRNRFPFSTYGETALILGQNVIISLLVLRYTGRHAVAATFVVALLCCASLLFSDNLLHMKLLSYMQAGAGVLGIASKLPQILTIWQQGGTGQLSAFAVFNYLIGSLSRVFTTVQEVDDKLILYGFVVGFLLNAVLALQMIYYWDAPSEKAKGKRREVPLREKGNVKANTTSTKGPTTRRRG